jgi:hypothetical protein
MTRNTETDRYLKSVRLFCKQAPEIGSRVRIFLGVARTDGRDHFCVVRGPQDKPRTARVVGYRIEFGESAGVWPRDDRTINVLVTVVLATRHPLLKRRVTAHVSCLECVDQ